MNWTRTKTVRTTKHRSLPPLVGFVLWNHLTLHSYCYMWWIGVLSSEELGSAPMINEAKNVDETVILTEACIVNEISI